MYDSTSATHDRVWRWSGLRRAALRGLAGTATVAACLGGPRGDAFAQAGVPEYGGRRPAAEQAVEALAGRLGLDAGQVAAFGELRRETEPALQRAERTVARKRRALEALLAQGLPDAGRAREAVDALIEAETSLEQVRIALELVTRELLRPEQREALVAIREEERRAYWAAVGRDCESAIASFCANAEKGNKGLRCLGLHPKALAPDCYAHFGEVGRASTPRQR